MLTAKASRSNEIKINSLAASKGYLERATGLREAFEFLLAVDAQAPSSNIHQKAVAFMDGFKTLVETPSNDFIRGFLGFCFTARAKEQGLRTPSSELELTRPTGFPDAIWRGVDAGSTPQRYRSPYGQVDNDGWGTRAFQRDVSAYLEQVASEIAAKNPLSDLNLVKANEFAANIIFAYRKSVREQSAFCVSPADELAKLIEHCGTISETLLQTLTTQLSVASGITLEKALSALLKRIPQSVSAMDREMPHRLTEWAKRERPLTIADLNETQRASVLPVLTQGIRHLMRSGLSDVLELQWMSAVEEPLRKYQFTTQGSKPSPLSNLLGSARIKKDVEQLLERTATELAKEGLTGLSVEVDYSPFMWPRIAELLAVTKPQFLTVHSAQTERVSETSEISPRFLTRAEASTLPLNLSTSVHQAIEHDITITTRNTVTWQTDLSAATEIDGRSVNITITNDLTIDREVQALLGLKKPPAASFVIRERQSASEGEATTHAFGVFFLDLQREVAGYKRLDFGKELKVFVSLHRPEPKTLRSPNQVSLAERVASLPPATAPSGTTAKGRVAIASAPVREPRSKISTDQAVVAKAVLMEVPRIQEHARKSVTLKPHLPFSDAELLATLNILKNGERPGTKSLKGLRHYVDEDKNFKDCGNAANSVRGPLRVLLGELL